jgi:protocatechuate 3,4-dioxygenase beta subunit
VIQSFTGLALYFGLGSAAVFTNRKSLAQVALTPSCGSKTPAQLEGPFFIPNSPERSNLISAKDKAPKIQLLGEVLDQFCRPVQGAMLDFWQSDERGDYNNRSDRLRGHQFTDIKGSYFLFSLMPGQYTGRTPHLHVKVQRRNGSVLTTQLYFPNHPGNRRDFLFDQRLVLESRGSDFFFRFILPS